MSSPLAGLRRRKVIRMPVRADAETPVKRGLAPSNRRVAMRLELRVPACRRKEGFPLRCRAVGDKDFSRDEIRP